MFAKKQHSVRLSLLSALLVPALFCGPALGEVGIFMQVPGGPGGSEAVRGESTFKAGPGGGPWIDILSYNWGLSNAVSIGSQAGGGGAGKVAGQTFVVTKFLDSASGPLGMNLAQGTHLTEVKVQLVNRDGGNTFPFMEYVMKEVFVSSYTVGATSGDPRPIEQIELTYGSIEWIYTQVDANGRALPPQPYGWNFLTNRRI